MTITGTKGTRAVSNRYPVEDGITAETTTQEGHTMNLIPEEQSLVSDIDKRYLSSR